MEKMQWFNEPEQWKIENQALTMYVTPQSDYWRISLMVATMVMAMSVIIIYSIAVTGRCCDLAKVLSNAMVWIGRNRKVVRIRSSSALKWPNSMKTDAPN